MAEELLFDGWPCDIPKLMQTIGPVELAKMILMEPDRWSWGEPWPVPAIISQARKNRAVEPDLDAAMAGVGAQVSKG